MAERITVSVDSDVAKIYRSAPDSDRRKLDLLVNFVFARCDRIREIT